MASINSRILLLSLVAIAFVGGVAMAAPKGNANHGFDEYGYNERADAFNGCWANYLNWKYARPVVECTETDLQVHAKWKFDKEESLMWLLNVFYSPVTGQTVLKKYVTISQEACTEAGGRWLLFQKVTQTGEIVPVCQILEAVEGEDPLLVATPAGFGHYKNE